MTALSRRRRKRKSFALLVLVADAVLGETQLRHPVDRMGWRHVLEELAHAMRTALSAHPNVAAVFATAGIILAAIYVLWMYQRTMNGPVRDEVKGMPDLRPRELLAVAPLVVLLIGAGVYPKPVLDIINPAVRVTMTQVHTTDPKPAHPASNTLTAVQKGTSP